VGNEEADHGLADSAWRIIGLRGLERNEMRLYLTGRRILEVGRARVEGADEEVQRPDPVLGSVDQAADC